MQEQWYEVTGVAVKRRPVNRTLQLAESPEEAQRRALAASGCDAWEAPPMVKVEPVEEEAE